MDRSEGAAHSPDLETAGGISCAYCPSTYRAPGSYDVTIAEGAVADADERKRVGWIASFSPSRWPVCLSYPRWVTSMPPQ